MRRSRKLAAIVGAASVSAVLAGSALAMSGAAPENATWTAQQAKVKYSAVAYDNATWTRVPTDQVV